MGFWQGVAEGYKDISAEQARKKEKEADRAFEREQFMARMQEERRNNLLALMAKRRASGEDSANLVNKAKALSARIGAADDPRLQKIISDPLLAAKMYDEITKLDAERAKNDRRALSGTELLDAVSYYTEDGTPKVTPGKSFGLDDLDRLSADPAAYEEAVLEMSQVTKRPEPVVSINQDAFRPRRYEQEKQATDYFNGMVLSAASKYAESLGEDATGYSNLKATIADAQKDPNGAGMQTLYSQFGPDVYKTFVEVAGAESQEFLLRNPILASQIELFKSDIKVAQGGGVADTQRQKDLQTLQEVMSDPNQPESVRKRAENMYNEMTGKTTRPQATPESTPVKPRASVVDEFGGYGNLAGDYSRYVR